MLSIELLKDVQDYIIARYAEVGEELERDNAIGYWNEHTADNDLPIPSCLRVSTSNAEIAQVVGGAIPKEKNPIMPKAVSKPELDPLKQILANADAGFGQILLEYIDASGMTDAEVYRKAQISRSHFNKIKNDPNYHIKKETVMAFLLALKLDFATASELLGKAGYTFTNSSKFDLIIRYCIEYGIYDVMEANQLLFSFDQKLLGAGIKE